MTPFPLDTFFEALVNGLWRGGLLVLATAVALRLWKRATAAERYVVWFAVLLVIAAAPVIQTAAVWTAPPALDLAALAPPSPTWEPAAPVGPLSAPAWSWSPIELEAEPLLLAWFAIALLFGVRLVRRCAFALQLKRDSAAPEGGLAVELADWERRLSGARRAPTRVSRRMPSPGAVGWLAPAVLLPAKCERQPPWDEVELLWRHEQAHVARRDDWTQLAAEVLCAALWFHPAVYWIKRELEREREMACDEAVVDGGVAPESYARALGRWAEQAAVQQSPVGVMGIGRSKAQIIRRMEMLLSPSRILRRGRTGWALAAGLAAAFALAGLLAVSGPSIVRAQTAAEPVIPTPSPAPALMPAPVPMPAPVVVPPLPPIAQAAPVPSPAPAPPPPRPPRAAREAELDRVREVEEQVRRLKPQIDAVHQEAARVGEFIRDNLRPYHDRMRETARAIAEEHNASIAPLAREIAELALQQREATDSAAQTELRLRMEALAERMKERQPMLDQLESKMSQIQVDMAPMEARLKELEAVLKEKEEALRDAQQELDGSLEDVQN